jgi:cation diffusion facilitator CzcD-associated flavoprotein CzcO
VVPEFDTGIVGAGFGGVIAALALKQAGHSFTIFEREGEPGGVWRDNRYPGCACDVRSHLYSIRDQPNPHWRSSYASQPEILAYLKRVIEQNGLAGNIRYRSRVVEVQFDEEKSAWCVSGADGNNTWVRTLILATGPQNRPALPRIPGIARFGGIHFHSSAWDDSISIAGKRVAVVGTGASAIQIVPNIAPSVGELKVFQRTPAWILPRRDRPNSELLCGALERFPTLQRGFRSAIYWSMELAGLGFLGNQTVHRMLTRIALNKLRREVPDPGLRNQLTPTYSLGCKRVLVSDDFYPTFRRPNVHLVTDTIEEVTESGLRTAGGVHHDVDVIVYATGFNVANTDGYLRVVGREGRTLAEDWNRNGSQAYLGIHVSGYPNLSLLLGPNSGLGHSSALHVMESQMAYIVKYLAEVAKLASGESLDVRSDVQSRYCEALQVQLAKTIWASGCRSWYLDEAGRNSTLYPGLTADYRRVTSRFDRGVYETFVPEATSSAASAASSSARG